MNEGHGEELITSDSSIKLGLLASLSIIIKNYWLLIPVFHYDDKSPELENLPLHGNFW